MRLLAEDDGQYSWSQSSCAVSLQVRRKREAHCKTSQSRGLRQKLELG